MTDENTKTETEEDTAPDRSQTAGVLSFENPSGGSWKQEKSERDTKPRTRSPGRPKGSTSSKAKTKRSVARFYVGLGVVTSKFDRYDGKVLLANAEQLTEETMKLAEEYPWLMDKLEDLGTISAVGGFIGVSMAVAIPIMVNHGMLPIFVLDFMDAPELEEEDEDEDDTPEILAGIRAMRERRFGRQEEPEYDDANIRD